MCDVSTWKKNEMTSMPLTSKKKKNRTFGDLNSQRACKSTAYSKLDGNEYNLFWLLSDFYFHARAICMLGTLSILGNTYINSLANPSGTATKFYQALYILDTVKTGFLHDFIKADTKASKSSSFQKLKRL